MILPYVCGTDFQLHLPMQQDGDEDLQHQEGKLNQIFSQHIWSRNLLVEQKDKKSVMVDNGLHLCKGSGGFIILLHNCTYSLPWAGEPDQETDSLLWAGMCVCMDVCEIPKEQLGRDTVLFYKSCSPLRLKVNCKVIHVLMQASLQMLDFEHKKSRYHSSLILSLGSCT